MEKDRKLWIDLLNIAACMGVVLLHCSNRQVHEWDGDFDVELAWGVFTHTFFLWPVPIFLMISGMNLIGYSKGWETYAKRRAQRALVPFIAWSLVYNLLVPLVKRHTGIGTAEDISTWQELAHLLLTGEKTVLWFFPPLFLLYLAIPFLSVFFRHSQIKTTAWLIAVGFALTSLLPFVEKVSGVEILGSHPAYLTFFGIVGYSMGKAFKERVIKHYKSITFGGGIACVAAYALIIAARKTGNDALDRGLVTYLNPLCVATSVAVFALFMSVDWSRISTLRRIGRQRIARLSSLSLGIYLLHPLVLMASGKMGLPFGNPYFGFVLTYSVCAAAIWLAKKIPMVRACVP